MALETNGRTERLLNNLIEQIYKAQFINAASIVVMFVLFGVICISDEELFLTPCARNIGTGVVFAYFACSAVFWFEHWTIVKYFRNLARSGNLQADIVVFLLARTNHQLRARYFCFMAIFFTVGRLIVGHLETPPIEVCLVDYLLIMSYSVGICQFLVYPRYRLPKM